VCSVVPWFRVFRVFRVFRGSVVPWFRGSVVPWFRGSVVPWFRGSVVPWLLDRRLALHPYQVTDFNSSMVLV